MSTLKSKAAKAAKAVKVKSVKATAQAPAELGSKLVTKGGAKTAVRPAPPRAARSTAVMPAVAPTIAPADQVAVTLDGAAALKFRFTGTTAFVNLLDRQPASAVPANTPGKAGSKAQLAAPVLIRVLDTPLPAKHFSDAQLTAAVRAVKR